MQPCDRPVMVLLTSTLVIGQQASYHSCPVHVDSVVARLQDELHTEMVVQQGALEDWWYDASGEQRAEPEPVETER